MAKRKGLTVKELKKICDLIGKKDPNGKPITKRQIRQWPSVKGGKGDR